VSLNVRQLQDREMEKNDKKFWFPAMKYGVGWGFPVTWQGWAVLLAYIALLFLGGLFIQMSPFLIIPFVIYVLGAFPFRGKLIVL
jgi:hypothetical protein